jgi:hypothetical protein
MTCSTGVVPERGRPAMEHRRSVGDAESRGLRDQIGVN